MNNKINFFLTLLVITISGNPAAEYFGKEVFIILPAVTMLGWAMYKQVRVTSRDYNVLAFFLAIYFFHLIEFGDITLYSSFGMFLKLLTALLAVRTIPSFTEKYVTVMYGLAIMSLIFYIPWLLGVDLPSLLAPFSIPLNPGDINIGLHNFTPEYNESLIRNRGFFWEPGAYAGYLILALLLTLKDIKKVPRRYFVVLIAALISTQSTTGYLAFIVVVLTMYVVAYGKSFSMSGRIATAYGVVIMLFIASIAYNNLSFLKEKMTDQFDDARAREGQYFLGRYGNLLYDLDFIEARPVFGWSSLVETRKVELEKVQAQGNGLSGYAVKYGLVGIFGFIFFSFSALSSQYGSRNISAVSIFVVAMLLSGEQFLNYTMFLTLMFVTRGTLKPLAGWGATEINDVKFLARKTEFKI